MTIVLNLLTGEIIEYTCSPAQAVVAAYEQSKKNWNTWDYKQGKNHPEFAEGKWTVRCGNFCAKKNDANNKDVF